MSDSVDYGNGSNLQAGEFFVTDQQPVGADTWHKGMLMEYDAVNHIYIALATDANLAAIYNGKDGRVLSSAGVDDVVLAGEIQAASLVDAAGDPLTLTQDQIATYRNRGFYIK